MPRVALRPGFSLACLLISTAVSAAEPVRIDCQTTNGASGANARAVVINLPRLAGAELSPTCMQTIGEQVAVGVQVISSEDRGAEQLLNEERGAELYVAALAGGKAATLKTIPMPLLGGEERLFRMKGELFGLSDAEILTARVRVSGHNVIFLAVYPASRANKYRLAATRIFEQARITIQGAVVEEAPGAAGKVRPRRRQ
ncbi:MAG: hypothetical protein M3Y59_11010 [Myxococcota bacterium]|nr:hypothetical protein [Myxococcota bacterium]